jgi:alpha-glucosidase (family GH31 glycosyl hydrolase)
VSDDIGSYLGSPGLIPQDPPDLYDRWVQFGTFQPILRLHSADGNRLPWQYPQPVSGITEDFLRLREALIPYTYTLAADAHQNGLPITQPLYLDYPDLADAYSHPGEYLYGSDMLVAPVTDPGSVAGTTVWIPPGRWVDFFTGATFTGPMTTTVSVPLSRMPVFVRAGGIIPQQASSGTSSTGPTGPTTLEVFSGSSGSFSLYGDAGKGLGYTTGQYTETPITDAVGGAESGAVKPSRVTIGAAHGHYSGEPATVDYRVELVDLTQPTGVSVNGRLISRQTSGSQNPGWYYQPDTSTVVINTGSMPTTKTVSVVATNSRTVDRPEPSASARWTWPGP